jgi:hypothetical protein
VLKTNFEAKERKSHRREIVPPIASRPATRIFP